MVYRGCADTCNRQRLDRVSAGQSGRLTWFLRKGRSHLENRLAMNVKRFGDILLRWRQRHTLALCSSRESLVWYVRHLRRPLRRGRVS